MSTEAAGTLAQIIPVFLLVISLTSNKLSKYELIVAAAMTLYLCSIEALLILAVVTESNVHEGITPLIYILTVISIVLITTPRIAQLLGRAYEREHGSEHAALRAEITKARMVEAEREYERAMQAKDHDQPGRVTRTGSA